MPFQLPCGVNMESGVIDVEKVTQKHIEVLLAEGKQSSLQENDCMYRLTHELVCGFISSNEWKNIFLI